MSEQLYNYVMNERPMYEAFVALATRARTLIDMTAEQVAKDKAEWHDDPSADDYEAFHAPAHVQFPTPSRTQAALDVLRYLLECKP